MRAIVRQAQVAARGTAPILLLGEGGTGKTHLAQEIHKAGSRVQHPFITIRCKAIPRQHLVEEVLGFRLNANERRLSKFEMADKGTLFFSQIEHLTPELQHALLHVVETGHVLQPGSAMPVRVDVRIMASTSADLERLVTRGKFIPELYYRFRVFRFQLPPLRERKDDIPALIERLLEQIAAEQQREAPIQIDDQAVQILCSYPWPGNIRELAAVLEYAASQSQARVIGVVDLPQAVREGRVIRGSHPQASPIISLMEAEREAILRAGWASHGKVSEMARMLGIGRTTLWRKLKALGMEPEYFQE
jgi:transcriptional activator for dhaKLM operon